MLSVQLKSGDSIRVFMSYDDFSHQLADHSSGEIIDKNKHRQMIFRDAISSIEEQDDPPLSPCCQAEMIVIPHNPRRLGFSKLHFP